MATGGESIGPENSTSSQDVITNNIVLNLSKYILSPAELSVLNKAKGLSFCPTSSQIDYSEIMEGVENTPTNETHCFLSTSIRSKRFHIRIVTINLTISNLI